MSLTSKQIDALRAYAKDRKGELAKLIADAADTIEMLSVKLHTYMTPVDLSAELTDEEKKASMEYVQGYSDALKDTNQRWIPCSERLPYAEYGESDTVLTTCGHRDVEDTSVRWIRLLYFNGGNWCYPTGETYEAKVYAWMPLPEPYREEGD